VAGRDPLVQILIATGYVKGGYHSLLLGVNLQEDSGCYSQDSYQAPLE
jgi:hypothetical protein